MRDTHPSPDGAASPEQIRTGIGGFDAITGGDLPPGRVYLIEGQPGSGKTTFGLQFLLAGVEDGERTLYISLSQTVEGLRQIAHSHGFDLAGVELLGFDEGGLTLPEGQEHTLFHPADVDLTEMMGSVREVVERVDPQRVVFDSAAELRLLAGEPLRMRRQFLALRQFFTERDTTVLVLDDETARAGTSAIHSIMHGVVRMEQHPPNYGTIYRRLRILKLRGMAHPTAYQDFRIVTGGIDLFPAMPVEGVEEGAKPEVLHSGVAELDRILGGGIDFGSSCLVLGVSGTGKSSLASLYAIAAAERGLPAAMYTFDEREDTVLLRSDSLGLPLREHVEGGRVSLEALSPATTTSGEFAFAIREAVRERGVRVVVVDSLTGYLHTVPPERRPQTQLHDLLAFLGRSGVLTLITVPQHGLVGNVESQVDVSYLADTVLLLRHFEADGFLRKALSVVKRRRGEHDHGVHHFRLTGEGVHVGPPIEGYQGILTGVPAIGGNNASTPGSAGANGN